MGHYVLLSLFLFITAAKFYVFRFQHMIVMHWIQTLKELSCLNNVFYHVITTRYFLFRVSTNS